MNFYSKRNKILSTLLVSIGAACTIGSGVMLGIGTNYNFYENNIKIGVGSVNFAKNNYHNTKVSDFLNSKSYNNWVSAARDNKNTNNKFFKSIIFANDLMIAGAVLISFSSLTLIVGIILFILYKIKLSTVWY